MPPLLAIAYLSVKERWKIHIETTQPGPLNEVALKAVGPEPSLLRQGGVVLRGWGQAGKHQRLTFCISLRGRPRVQM